MRTFLILITGNNMLDGGIIESNTRFSGRKVVLFQMGLDDW